MFSLGTYINYLRCGFYSTKHNYKVITASHTFLGLVVGGGCIPCPGYYFLTELSEVIPQRSCSHKILTSAIKWLIALSIPSNSWLFFIRIRGIYTHARSVVGIFFILWASTITSFALPFFYMVSRRRILCSNFHWRATLGHDSFYRTSRIWYSCHRSCVFPHDIGQSNTELDVEAQDVSCWEQHGPIIQSVSSNRSSLLCVCWSFWYLWSTSWLLLI